ncbi:UNVERIFIED_CONTAM: hypothetical protein FKN15_055658 [Acipenser sinensis]
MLEVISLLTGKCLSRHHFGDDKIVGQVKDFVWEKRWCLLVELQDSSGFFYLCCYCLGTSRVVRAISLPSKVKCMEVIGDKWFKDTGHLHTTLTCFAGAAALGTDQGDILLLDLALADKKHNRTEKEATEYELLAGFDTGYEDELKETQLQEIHPCVRLHIQAGACATSLAFITHTNQLVVGYSMGILQFWNLLHLHMEEGATIKINLLELLFREYSASAQVHYHKEQDKGPNCITPSISKERPEESNGVCSLQVSLESSDSVLDSDSIFTSECIPEIGPGDDLESVNEIAEDDQKLLGCPDLLLTIDRTTSSTVLNSLDKDTHQEMIWSALEEMDSEQTCTIVCNQLATGGGATDLAMDMTEEDGERWLNVMNLHPQFYSNEDNQRTFLTCDSPVDNGIFRSSAKAKKIPHATGRQHPHHHGIFSQSAPKQRAEKSEGRQREKVLQCKCIVSMLGSSTQVTDPQNLNSRKSFHFDHCYWSHDEYTENEQGVHVSDGHHSRYADQAKVFNDLGRTILENVWRGFNATLFAYGQTGSGKSYTMTGYGQNKGLVSMICEELFRGIREKQSPERQFNVYFSMFEIYNEQIVLSLSKLSFEAMYWLLWCAAFNESALALKVQDLLSKVRKPGGLRVREGRKGFYVECLKAVSCESYEKLEALLQEGIRNRSMAATNMNATSSRSHMVINLRFKQVLTKEHCLKQSEIDLVDLAGSEKQRSSGSTSDRFNEARAINLSLTTLGNVISALSDKAVGKKIHHIPYRNSTLTRLLRTALGGNSKTVMNISFELEIKHLAFMDASGGELDKEVIVRVRNTNNQVWVWSKERFAECMLLMEDMYKRDSQENLQHDFFKDPVENIHLGSAQVWLESLAYCMRYEEQVDASNSQGDEEAIVHVKLLPCNADGVPLGEEAAVVDLEDLLGRRMDFQVQISQCLGVKWIKEQSSRGIQIGFQIYELPIVFYTNSCWGNINPTLAYSVHVTIQHVTMEFLNYLKTHAIILELFGLQEGCPEMETSYADIPLSNEGTILLDMCYQDSQQSCTSKDSGNDFSELRERLLHLELECDKLREENRVLKTENFEMRGEMEEQARQGPIPDNTSISEKLSNDRLSGRSAFPNFDAEFAKALKRFYFGMNGVKGKLNHLKEIQPLDEYNIRSLQYFVDERIELIKEFGGDLEGCVGKMKSDVEKIILKKKEILLALSAK